MYKALILSLLFTACALDPEVSKTNQRFVREGQIRVLSCETRQRRLLYCSGFTGTGLPVNWYCNSAHCAWFLPE